MRTFVHNNSGPRIVFGPGALAGVADEVSRLGGSRAFVLSTPGRRDLADRVVEELDDSVAGTFDGATMHTPVEVTERALTQARAVGADCARLDRRRLDHRASARPSRPAHGIPQLVLPTTYAGSEVTPVLGETADGEKTTRSSPGDPPGHRHLRRRPHHDPARSVTVTSGVNAMAHAVEALYAADATPITDQMAPTRSPALAAGLRALAAGPDRPRRPRRPAVRRLAGRHLPRPAVGMGLHHKLCHTLGGTFGLPHAATHTVVLPHAMAYNAPAAPAGA